MFALFFQAHCPRRGLHEEQHPVMSSLGKITLSLSQLRTLVALGQGGSDWFSEP